LLRRYAPRNDKLVAYGSRLTADGKSVLARAISNIKYQNVKWKRKLTANS
jgi:hypothetical protein